MGKMKSTKFELGRVVSTSGVASRIQSDHSFAAFCCSSLDRHSSGDWGDMCKADKKANDDALVNGGRLFSAYESKDFPKIWIITEADNSATTILYPDEY